MYARRAFRLLEASARRRAVRAGRWNRVVAVGGRAVPPREFRVSRSRRASRNEVPQVERKGAAWRTQPGRERRCSNAGPTWVGTPRGGSPGVCPRRRGSCPAASPTRTSSHRRTRRRRRSSPAHAVPIPSHRLDRPYGIRPGRQQSRHDETAAARVGLRRDEAVPMPRLHEARAGEQPFTAMATALPWPTSTTSRLPRVMPV